MGQLSNILLDVDKAHSTTVYAFLDCHIEL